MGVQRESPRTTKNQNASTYRYVNRTREVARGGGLTIRRFAGFLWSVVPLASNTSTMSDEATARQQQAQEELLRRLNERFIKQYVPNYPINVAFPAKVSSSSDKPVRTDKDLVQHRLLEAGVMFEDKHGTVGDMRQALEEFVSVMNKSTCYNSVQVMIEGNPSRTSEEEPTETLNVVLNEKKWYRLYIGGGLKHESLENFGTESTLLPKLQFETSGGLLNLTGHLDTTSLQYAVDQTSSSTLSFQHGRPLYSLLPENSPSYDYVLTSSKGSQISVAFRAVLDTLDYEWSRSYKEYQRLLSVRVSNTANVIRPESVSFQSSST